MRSGSIILLLLCVSYSIVNAEAGIDTMTSHANMISGVPNIIMESESAPSKEVLLKFMPDDHIIGDKNAKIILIEYSSLACPHCADFHENVFPKLKERYLDNGNVLYIHRQFPTNQPSVAAAALCICSGTKYFQFIDALLISQNTWAITEHFRKVLLNIAKLSGMENSKFDRCLDNKELLRRIYQSNLWASNILGIDATPTFFLNGEKIDGAPTYISLARRIDKLLSLYDNKK